MRLRDSESEGGRDGRQCVLFSYVNGRYVYPPVETDSEAERGQSEDNPKDVQASSFTE